MSTIPIRCYSCGKVIGNKWNSYQNILSEGVSSEKALDRLGLKRWCCRRIILGHVELIEKLLKYSREENALAVKQKKL